MSRGSVIDDDDDDGDINPVLLPLIGVETGAVSLAVVDIDVLFLSRRVVFVVLKRVLTISKGVNW
jgi:hypothetical protein